MPRTFTAALYLSTAILAVPAFAAAVASIKLTVSSGPPTSSTSVSGKKFGAGEAVDIFFDATDLALVEANRKGAFRPQPLTVPANAQPGAHWITAVGRTSGDTAQRSFLVRTDWPQFGLNALGGRLNPYENTVSTADASQLAPAWTAAHNTSSSAAVVGGIAYFGSGDAFFYAYDAANGHLKWSFHTNGSVGSSPAVDGGDIFFGSDDKNVYGLTTSGAAFWTNPFQANDKVEGAPAVADSMVFIGSDDTYLYALNEKDGTKAWSFKTQGVVRSAPAVANGIVYVTSYDGLLYAVDEASGGKLWSFPTGAAIGGAPVLANGSVYIGSGDGNAYAVNAATGSKLWTFNAHSPINGAPVVANNVVYVATNNGVVYAIDARLGTQIWSVTLNSALNYAIGSSMTLANGVLYFGDVGGYVYALNAANGSTLWFAVAPTSIYASATISDGVLYLGSHDAEGHGAFSAYALNGNTASMHPNRQPPPLASLRPNRKLPLLRE